MSETQEENRRSYGTLDVAALMERIPHRFPFLMVDRVEGWEPKAWIRCTKCVTGNEPFFQGHFPGRPVMPGVLQIEAAAQASALLVHLSEPERTDLLVFAQIKRFTFLGIVEPGDVLDIRVESRVMQGPTGMADVEIRVGERSIAKGTLLFGSAGRE